MAKKSQKDLLTKEDIPENIDNHIFYGLQLDEQQRDFRNSIWSENYDVIFANAKAGTGKTLLAVATAKLLVQHRNYDGLVYMVAPTQQERNGFLPGGIVEKDMPYYAPLFDALTKISEQPEKAIKQLGDPKTTNGWIDCMSHTYTRGINLDKKVIICEESQNFYTEELKKVLTRIIDNCKVIVIGHSEQVDLFKNPKNSGFVKYIEHFREKERCKVCELTKNYRGWISQHADDLII